MITATEHGLETPQRVRQYFVDHRFEEFTPSPAGADINGSSSLDTDSSENESDPTEDLPTFLRNRSLRRRLDDAFDACYQSTLGEWLRMLFRRA